MKPQIELVPWWAKIPARLAGWVASLLDRLDLRGKRPDVLKIHHDMSGIFCRQAHDARTLGRNDDALELFRKALQEMQWVMPEVLALKEPDRALTLRYMAEIAVEGDMPLTALRYLEAAVNGKPGQELRHELEAMRAALLEPGE